MTTFVSVGNAKQPFRRLLKAVQENGDVLPPPVTVQFGHNRFNDARFDCVEFLKMDAFRQRVESSSVVVLHGGAGSVITALTFAKIPIVMARRPESGEHIDHHQLEFVSELARAGRLIAVADAVSLREAVTRILTTAPAVIQCPGQAPALLEKVAEDIRRVMNSK